MKEFRVNGVEFKETRYYLYSKEKELFAGIGSIRLDKGNLYVRKGGGEVLIKKDKTRLILECSLETHQAEFRIPVYSHDSISWLDILVDLDVGISVFPIFRYDIEEKIALDLLFGWVKPEQYGYWINQDVEIDLCIPVLFKSEDILFYDGIRSSIKKGYLIKSGTFRKWFSDGLSKFYSRNAFSERHARNEINRFLEFNKVVFNFLWERS